MTKKDILKDEQFEEVSETRTDSKNRVALGRAVKIKARIYKVYQNSLGQIILDPQVSIPAHEAWLFRNPEALTAVRKGLDDVKKGRLRKTREDYSKYTRESD